MFKIYEIRLLSMLPEIMKKFSNTHLKHLGANGVRPVFLFRDFNLHLRFQMFKICEIRLYSYVV